MAKVKTDLFIIRGDSASIHFELTDDGSAVDLTDCTVYFTAKSAIDNDLDDSEAAIAVEVTSHTDPTNGITDIPLTSSDTDVTPGEYFYDIQVKKADNTIVSIKYRKLEILGDVTRRTS